MRIDHGTPQPARDRAGLAAAAFIVQLNRAFDVHVKKRRVVFDRLFRTAAAPIGSFGVTAEPSG
ncbi:hypothetical protein D3C83_158040 [compost metagenome]